jgi:hypothetical protein
MHQSLAADAPFNENSLSEQKTSPSIPHEHSANSAVQHQKSWHRTIATQASLLSVSVLIWGNHMFCTLCAAVGASFY